ncbi:MAG: polymer-forming cytoskeletal protein [Chitinophagales bacterium]|nr:polymer-forming cytoskeletal protein [Chitinophagales bacterium]
MVFSSPSASSSSSTVNIIGPGTQIVGEINSESDIRIEGKIKGTIHSKAKVTIGTSGVVDGDILCDSADMSGKIFGKLEVSDMLFLKSTAYLEGDITTGKLIVEAGARFTGSCRMGVKEIKPSEKPSQNQIQKKEAI